MTLPNPLVWLLQAIFALLLPALLLIGLVRLVMNPAFLTWEYTRAGFPVDEYGLTTEDRLELGPYGVLYIVNNEPISYLGDLRLEGEKCYPPDNRPCPAFNQLELQHMQDVQKVAQGAFTFGYGAAIAALILVVILWRFVSISALRSAIMQGASLTLGLIAAIIILAIGAWDAFFGGFHSLFFQDGTWQFYYSDTLIRLYPEQFWFEAALFIGISTTLLAIILLLISWRMPSK